MRCARCLNSFWLTAFSLCLSGTTPNGAFPISRQAIFSWHQDLDGASRGFNRLNRCLGSLGHFESQLRLYLTARKQPHSIPLAP